MSDAAPLRAVQRDVVTEHRWRDGKGLVHRLARREAYYINEFATVTNWVPACGYPRKSLKRSQFAGPVTCLACAITEES